MYGMDIFEIIFKPLVFGRKIAKYISSYIQLFMKTNFIRFVTLEINFLMHTSVNNKDAVEMKTLIVLIIPFYIFVFSLLVA